MTLYVFLLIIRRQPIATLTYTLFPYTTLFRSWSYPSSASRPKSPARVIASWRELAPIFWYRVRRCDFKVFTETKSCSAIACRLWPCRSEEHTSELQSLMRLSYAVFCLKKKTKQTNTLKPKWTIKTNVYDK